MQNIFQLQGMLYLGGGSLLGLLFGILPGLGGPQVLALLIPITYGVDPLMAVLLLVGAMGAVPFGGSITAILLNTPGSPQNVATTFDGYPLARQGKAGEALGASATASALGAIFGAVVLAALIPVARQVVLLFSYPEYFMLAMLGLSVVALVSPGNLLKGLIAGGVGLLVSFIGYDPMGGVPRFTFGMDYLWDGVSLIPVAIGLFAIAESIELFVEGGTIARGKYNISRAGLAQGVRAVFQNFGLFLRSAVLGTIIGIIPGVGGAVANFLAYLQALQTKKNPENFGKGDIRGVIAPEASNNAKDGGALVPTIAFGIPGSGEMAILLGALILHGLEPGPKLLLQRMDIIYALIIGLVLANLFVSVFGLLLANQLVRLTLVPTPVLAPLVFMLGLLGAYAGNGAMGDVVVAWLFGILGFGMKKHGYSRVALVIALVLGGIAERSFRQTLITLGPATFFTRPIALTLIILTAAILVLPVIRSRRRKGGVADATLAK